MTSEPTTTPPSAPPGAGEDDDRSPTEWAQTVKAALAGASVLIGQSPEHIAKLLAYEARYDDTPLYALLVEVKATAIWWQALLDALKREVLAG